MKNTLYQTSRRYLLSGMSVMAVCFACTLSVSAQTVSVSSGSTLYWPLETATVNIDVASVTDLLGIGAELSYDDSRISFTSSSVTAGAFLDDGTTLTPFENNITGTLAFSVSRSGDTGATGDGTAVTMTFDVSDFADPGTASFSLADLLAIDASGQALSLSISGGSFEIGGVWPGDTDNNCSVEATDLLPIGLLFGTTGPARSGFDVTWGAKAFSPWSTFDNSFADATGDGEVDQNDLLPIGVNFGDTRSETTGCSTGTGKRRGQIAYQVAPQPVGTVIEVQMELNQSIDSLVGTSFKLGIDPAVLAIREVRAGSFLDDGDLLQFVILDETNGIGDIAFTRKGSDRATSGMGELAVIQLEVIAPMEGTIEMTMDDVKLSTVPAGIYAAPEAVTLMGSVSTSNEALDLPEVFALHGAYPNPFNPTTTITYDLPEAAQVSLAVYDLLGREVQRLNLGDMAAGSQHTIDFNADGLSSGTYMYRLEARTASEVLMRSGQFVLLK